VITYKAVKVGNVRPANIVAISGAESTHRHDAVKTTS
jgi:D-arabinose 1-dehydrogenase-like Zn-dependent alcohol dehydrogenase